MSNKFELKTSEVFNASEVFTSAEHSRDNGKSIWYIEKYEALSVAEFTSAYLAVSVEENF